MIKLTYAELNSSTGGFMQLLDIPMPLAPALALRRIGLKVQAELKVFQGQSETFRKQFAEEGQKRIGEDKVDAYNEAMNNLLQTEIELDIEPIQIKSLELKSIKPSVLLSLEKFLVE